MLWLSESAGVSNNTIHTNFTKKIKMWIILYYLNDILIFYIVVIIIIFNCNAHDFIEISTMNTLQKYTLQSAILWIYLSVIYINSLLSLFMSVVINDTYNQTIYWLRWCMGLFPIFVVRQMYQCTLNWKKMSF